MTKTNKFITKLLLTYLLCNLSLYVNAQQNSVSGTVTLENGTPATGAIIRIQDGTGGTIADIDGKYQISVAESGILEFSLLGYKKQTVPVNGRKAINITLAEDAQMLDQVVVVGYSTINKRSLTGALQVIDDKKLKDTSSPSVENLLSGKSPGVQVSSASGQPGQVGKIVIRGMGSLNSSTDPLWVIDGVIVGNSAGNLNPSDIETLTILKDAASTAIYGSQGANGVVQVTTKSAKEGKLSIRFSASLIASRLNNGQMEMMNGTELYDLYDSMSNKEQLEKVTLWTPALRDRNYDWWDNATKTGFGQEYYLSLSGGSENIKAYMSVGYYDESGAIKGYDFTRYNLLTKVEYKPYNFLTIRPMVSGAHAIVDDRQHSVNAMYTNMPWDYPYTEDGVLVDQGRNHSWFGAARNNYLYDLQWNYTKRKTLDVAANMDFDVRITDWLTFASVNSYKHYRVDINVFTDPRSVGGRATEGRVEEVSRKIERLYTNQLFRINKAFGNHFINAVIGYEWNESKARWTSSSATGIPAGFEVQEAAVRPEKAESGIASSAVQSYLANLNYTFSSRYVGQVSFRRDGASNFGPDNRYGNFFSVSGAWNIHNENFFKVKDIINNMKLRASYGSQGNRPNAAYGHLFLYGTGRTQSYNDTPGALIYSYMGNRDLRWEKSYTTNIGLEMTLFDRVNVNLDYYHKNISDLLYAVDLPAVTGMSKSWKNAGKLQNQGFEAAIGVDIFKTQDFDWRIDANIGLNRNKIKSLYSGRTQMTVGAGDNIAGSAQVLYAPGKDSRTWWLKEWAGVDTKTGSAMWYKTAENGERVTTTSYAEANEVECGTSTPDFFGAFSTYARYKDFDLTATFNYSVGGQVYNYARMEYDSDGAYTDRNQMKLHSGWSRWEKEGDIATHPKAIYQNKTNSGKSSSRYLETATFLKMRSLTLGYNVPFKIKNISNVRLTLSGENIFTISHFSGVDPEIPPRYEWANGGQTSIFTGVATAVYPNTRKFVFGVNVSL